MATKKINSSKSSSSIPVVVDSDSSVQVRKIKNGFIVSESGTTGKGRNQQYYNNEFFSKNNPLKISGSSGNAGSSGGGVKFGSRK